MKVLVKYTVVMVLILMMISGCANEQKMLQNQVGLLTVTRNDPLHQYNNQEFTKTINNEDQVQKLLSMLKTLPEFPKGPINCPFDSGVTYQLDFLKEKTIAVVSASGCQQVKYNNKVYWGMDEKSNGFISYLMKILGLNRIEFTGI